MPELPEYDRNLAQRVSDWADVPGAPDQLHDAPTHCAFCGEFIPKLTATRSC